MKQSVYVLAMTLCPFSFGDEIHLDDHLVGYSGSDCKIFACHYFSDPFIFQLLENLNRQNSLSADDQDEFSRMQYEFFELIIESDKDLRYQRLSWLNDRIRSYFTLDENLPGGGYFFYLTGNEKNPEIEIVAKLKVNQIELDETNCGDDFSYIKNKAAFIDRYIYYNDAEEWHADIMAKLILQFGE